MGSTQSFFDQVSAERFAARPSPDVIRTGDVYVEGENGIEYRFEGTDEEFAEKYCEYVQKYPLHETYFMRRYYTRFEHESFKRKPSLAILQMYTADNFLQKLNIEVNQSATKEDLSNTDHLATSTNYNNSDGLNCHKPLLDLYLSPTKAQVRKLERCIGETYCSQQRSALVEVAKDMLDVTNKEEYLGRLEVYSNCVVNRPEFVHAHKVAEKLYRDDDAFKGNFA